MVLVGIVIHWNSCLNRLLVRLKGNPEIKAKKMQVMQELRLGACHFVAFNLFFLLNLGLNWNGKIDDKFTKYYVRWRMVLVLVC